jgi:tetratricopeptide (TPR) repeat protein
MRFFLLFGLLPFLFLASSSAQMTPLPPGSSMPGDDSASAQNSAAMLISKAEDAIVRNAGDEALPLLEKVIALGSATPQQKARAYYDRGYLEEGEQHLDAAEADYRRAVAADPRQFEAHASLGQLLAQRGQWAAARQELELAANLLPASGDSSQSIAAVDRTLAHVDAQLNDASAASDALLAALKRTPETADDMLLAAELAEQTHDEAGAEQQYRKLLTQDPKSVPAAEGLARILIHQRKFAESRTVLDKALQQSPNDPVLLALSATALANTGNYADAIPRIESLHRQNPKQPAITRMLADLYSTSGNFSAADPLYQQLLTTSPRDADLLTTAGENQMKQQHWAAAQSLFQRSVKIDPRMGDAWSDLAFAASENQQYALTLNALDQRAKTLADVPATYFLRATALDHLHRYPEATENYAKFLNAAQGKFPQEESESRIRLEELKKLRH